MPPPHNDIILDLLFILATWHGYAKLRLHTETTLSDFDGTTTALGKIIRHFVNITCAAFKTNELPREEAARGRREAANAKKGKEKATTGTSKRKERKERTFIMSTYKLHALSDYVASIRLFGTSDNYTTQVVRQADILPSDGLIYHF
jgi:hypothetical protein